MKSGWIVEKYENGPVFGYKVCEPVGEMNGVTLYRERFIVKTRGTAQLLSDLPNEYERLTREADRVNAEKERINAEIERLNSERESIKSEIQRVNCEIARFNQTKEQAHEAYRRDALDTGEVEK